MVEGAVVADVEGTVTEVEDQITIQTEMIGRTLTVTAIETVSLSIVTGISDTLETTRITVIMETTKITNQTSRISA